MSGHITMTSRGSRVGSSASRPSSTSRSTSTWRADPWQACTCTLWSSSASERPAGSTVAFAARSACSHDKSVPRPSVELVETRSALASVTATVCSVRCSSRTSRPSEASSGWSTRSWERSSTRDTAPRRSVRAVHSAADGCGSQRCTSRCSPSALSSSTSVTGIRVCPKSENRDGRSIPPGRSRTTERTSRWRRWGEGWPTWATSSRHSSGCQSRSSSRAAPVPSVSRPASHSLSRVGRCTAYDANRRASRRATAYRRPRRSSPSSPVWPWPRCRLSARHHAWPACASTTSSSGQTRASGDHGSSSRVPAPPMTSSATTLAGERSRTPAQTPSSWPSP